MLQVKWQKQLIDSHSYNYLIIFLYKANIQMEIRNS